MRRSDKTGMNRWGIISFLNSGDADGNFNLLPYPAQMIYIDVTSSCTSEQNAGMQRMTRKIFEELSRRLPVTPICWNQIGRSYHLLGQRERAFLSFPFEVRSRPTTRPDARGQSPVPELWRFLTLSRIDLLKTLAIDDVFITPDPHHDLRRKYLPRILKETPTRAVAIFHDAARSRLASLYGHRARSHEEYMQCLASFDLVVCVSNEAENDLLDFWKSVGCPRTSTTVEPWPAELEKLSVVPDGPSSNLVVYVSSLDPRKNHLTLLRAAEKLWNEGLEFELHLIGRITKMIGRRVVDEIQRLQRAGRAVRWLRHIDDKTLLREYAECRFTIYPSLMEGYGLPIVESLLHGKPCVCGGNGALGEVARGGGCLIVDQTNVAALADGIKTLLLDRQSYVRLRDEARARKFRSWADYIDRLLVHLQLTNHTAKAGAVSD
jgi:glycosyltransferase involved in cell wall biosynthesis